MCRRTIKRHVELYPKRIKNASEDLCFQAERASWWIFGLPLCHHSQDKQLADDLQVVFERLAVCEIAIDPDISLERARRHSHPVIEGEYHLNPFGANTHPSPSTRFSGSPSLNVMEVGDS